VGESGGRTGGQKGAGSPARRGGDCQLHRGLNQLEAKYRKGGGSPGFFWWGGDMDVGPDLARKALYWVKRSKNAHWLLIGIPVRWSASMGGSNGDQRCDAITSLCSFGTGGGWRGGAMSKKNHRGRREENAHKEK